MSRSKEPTPKRSRASEMMPKEHLNHFQGSDFSPERISTSPSETLLPGWCNTCSAALACQRTLTVTCLQNWKSTFRSHDKLTKILKCDEHSMDFAFCPPPREKITQSQGAKIPCCFCRNRANGIWVDLCPTSAGRWIASLRRKNVPGQRIFILAFQNSLGWPMPSSTIPIS